MKTNTSTLHAILFAGLLAIIGCNNGNNSSVQNMADSLQAKADTAMDKVKVATNNVEGKVEAAMSNNEDSGFVVKAAIANSTELKVLQAGIDKGTNKELKAHAKMMLADHKKLGDKVKAYSSKKGYTLPDGDNGKGDDAVTNLDKNSPGSDWDKAWTDHMLSAHEEAISMFERGQSGVKDDELKNIITGALPTLHAHLEMMKNLKDKLGK
jgi:putative membrane protein